MRTPSLNTSYTEVINQINRLEQYRRDFVTLDPKYQHLIAEVILLRLFSILEVYVRDVSVKIACKAIYLNGNIPTLLTNCTSMNDAESKFENFNRTKYKKSKWTNSNFSIDSIKKVIPATESIRIALTNHSPLFDEMRIVRNHIAHKTKSTYLGYKQAIFRIYAANLKIQPGALLVSDKRTTPRIDYYIAATKIFVHDIVKG